MLSVLRRQMKSDGGFSDLVTFMLLFVPTVAILCGMADMCSYFLNRTTIQRIAGDGARDVAIMGGKGTAQAGTPLEVRYGLGASTCDSIVQASPAYHGSSTTPVECQVIKRALGASLVNTVVTDVKCTPTITSGVGSLTSCTIDWEYGGLPLSLFLVDKARGEGSFYNATTKASSEAEVDMTGVVLQPRR